MSLQFVASALEFALLLVPAIGLLLKFSECCTFTCGWCEASYRKSIKREMSGCVNCLASVVLLGMD